MRHNHPARGNNPSGRLKSLKPLTAFFLLLPVFLFACSIPYREDTAVTETPHFQERHLVLIFERANTFTPLTGAEVKLNLLPPATLQTPSSGQAITGSYGEVELSYRPVAIYDQPALNDGDIIADYPAVFYITLRTPKGEVFEWVYEENLSYARYQDPLYQGLNRDPEPGPVYINLTLPEGF